MQVLRKGIKATNVVASENDYTGMDAPSVKATNVTASGNGYSGVSCKRCNLTGLVANDNGVTDIPVGAGGGVQGVGVRLVDSTLIGNVVDGVPVDIDTFVRPRLMNTSCEHSRQREEPSSSWGVCTAD